MDQLVIRVAELQGVDITTLVGAANKTDGQRAEFAEKLRQRLPPGEEDYTKVDVIVTGSFARGELTSGSDCDFLVTSLDTVGHRVMPAMVRHVQQVMDAMVFEKPGSQGVFNDFTPAADLIWRIGLDGDSNTNSTRRTLVLTESISVLQAEVRQTLIDRMLSRYCSDYHPRARTKDDPILVPRFLLNDVVRYWRTVAVDFGAKQWRSVRTDMGLRYAKLLTTRKVLFAGTLCTLFLTGLAVPAGDPTPYDTLKQYLQREFDRPPLARLMSAYDHVSDAGKVALGVVLDRYNQFIQILDTPDLRDLIEAGEDPEAKPLITRIEMLGADIEAALEQIFFDETVFAGLTRKYGLF